MGDERRWDPEPRRLPGRLLGKSFSVTSAPGQSVPGPPLGINRSWVLSYLGEGLPGPPGPPGSLLTSSGNAGESSRSCSLPQPQPQHMPWSWAHSLSDLLTMLSPSDFPP